MTRRPFESIDPLSAAGWLFAELALVLVIIVLGTETPRRPPQATPPPTTPAGEQGLSLESRTFEIDVPHGPGAMADFRARLDATLTPGEEVGLIMLFGRSRTANISEGTVVSEELRRALLADRVPRIPHDERYIRTYFGGGRAGTVEVELFVLNRVS